MEHFQIGTEFHTYKELLAAKYRYEQDTKTLLTTKKSAKYTSDDPRCEDLVYSRIQYQCKAGEERKSTSKGNRAVTSGKMNCPVQVTMSAKEGKLCVLNSMLVHVNHTQDYETFMKYPENLRLKPHEIRYARELLTKGFNKKTIKSKLKENRGGMPVSPKFWAQIHRASKKDATAGIEKHEDVQDEDFADQTFDHTSSFGFSESPSMVPEVKVVFEKKLFPILSFDFPFKFVHRSKRKSIFMKIHQMRMTRMKAIMTQLIHCRICSANVHPMIP